jgi:DNA/RNA endonuclease G (NUC1)
VAVCACYSKPWERAPRWRFTLKPADKSGPVARYVRSLLVVPALSTAAAFSSKIQLSVFRLQFVVSYNWERKAPNLEYRITTKWSDGPRIQRKERFLVSPRCRLSCKWNLDAHLPDMEGCALLGFMLAGGGGV